MLTAVCGFIFVPTLVAFGRQESGGTVVVLCAVLCAVVSGWYMHVRVVYSLLLSVRSEVACSFVGHSLLYLDALLHVHRYKTTKSLQCILCIGYRSRDR